MSNQDNTTLLENLKQLYFRFLTLVTQNQIRSGINHSSTTNPHNITSSLSECIDKLSTHASHGTDNNTPKQAPNLEKNSREHAVISSEPPSQKELGDFSLHLKDSHKYSGISLDTGGKLIQSTWEHFHASIRLARQGNVKKARVHMEIANNALREAEHYLPEQAYSHFSQEVMQALDEISEQI